MDRKSSSNPAPDLLVGFSDMQTSTFCPTVALAMNEIVYAPYC